MVMHASKGNSIFQFLAATLLPKYVRNSCTVHKLSMFFCLYMAWLLRHILSALTPLLIHSYLHTHTHTHTVILPALLLTPWELSFLKVGVLYGSWLKSNPHILIKHILWNWQMHFCLPRTYFILTTYTFSAPARGSSVAMPYKCFWIEQAIPSKV
jgi:hypothetical protein